LIYFRINISVLDFVKNLPQFNRTNYQSARLPFDLFRPYAYLLEEKYRGRAGNIIKVLSQMYYTLPDLVASKDEA
jgi:hypothetical protein